MKYIFSLLLCCTALAQQTVNNFVVKTNLTVSGVKIGVGAGYQGSNIQIGSNSFGGTALGQRNVVIGPNAASAATTPTNNVIIGQNAALSLTSSDNNVVVGQDAYRTATIGSSNPVDPSYNTGAHNNIALGRASMYSMYDGRNNFAAGTFSMFNATNGNFDVGIGVHSLNDLVYGDSNTAIGESSLYKATTGNQNTALGNGAGFYSTGAANRNVYIGFNAGPSSLTTESDKLYIDNAAGIPLIGADFAANTITFSGRLGVGANPIVNHGYYQKDVGSLLVENPNTQDTQISILSTGTAYSTMGYNSSSVTNTYGARPDSAYFGTPQQKDVWISSAGGRLKVSTPNGVTSWITITTLPTSVVGLPSGTLWNNLGVLNVAP
jgi:hypothetical protein